MMPNLDLRLHCRLSLQLSQCDTHHPAVTARGPAQAASIIEPVTASWDNGPLSLTDLHAMSCHDSVLSHLHLHILPGVAHTKQAVWLHSQAGQGQRTGEHGAYCGYIKRRGVRAVALPPVHPGLMVAIKSPLKPGTLLCLMAIWVGQSSGMWAATGTCLPLGTEHTRPHNTCV